MGFPEGLDLVDQHTAAAAQQQIDIAGQLRRRIGQRLHCFIQLLQRAGLGDPFDEETLRRVCSAADAYLDNYDLTGID